MLRYDESLFKKYQWRVRFVEGTNCKRELMEAKDDEDGNENTRKIKKRGDRQ